MSICKEKRATLFLNATGIEALHLLTGGSGHQRTLSSASLPQTTSVGLCTSTMGNRVPNPTPELEASPAVKVGVWCCWHYSSSARWPCYGWHESIHWLHGNALGEKRHPAILVDQVAAVCNINRWTLNLWLHRYRWDDYKVEGLNVDEGFDSTPISWVKVSEDKRT